MKYAYPVLLLLIVSFILLRSVPAIKYDLPTGYDVYFHMRVIETYREGNFPAFDRYDCQGRWINYPPLFHLMLAALPLPAILLVKFSSVTLIALAAAGVFLLAKGFFNERTALVASFFFLESKEIADASFGSGMPQALGILLMPFAAYLFHCYKKSGSKKMLLAATLLLSAMAMAHTFSFAIAIAVIFAYNVLNKPRLLDFAFLASALPFIAWLIFMQPFSVFYPTFWGNEVDIWLLVDRLALILPLSIIGMYFIKKRSMLSVWFIILTVFSISWIAGIYIMNIRALPFLAIPASILAASVLTRISGNKKWLVLAAIAASLIPGIIYPLEAAPLVKDKDELAMAWINENIPGNETFISPEEISGMYLSYFIQKPMVSGAYAESCPDRYSRTESIRRFFLAQSCSVVEEVAEKYSISYVYINSLERNYYKRTYGTDNFIFEKCSAEKLYDNGFAAVWKVN